MPAGRPAHCTRTSRGNRAPHAGRQSCAPRAGRQTCAPHCTHAVPLPGVPKNTEVGIIWPIRVSLGTH
eukprot:4443812-Lingulodinium_polyedra.AAC.1